MSGEPEAVANWVNIELTAILDECGYPDALDEASRKRLDALNKELASAIKEGRYPMAALLEIRKIYSKRGGENGGIQ